LMPPSVEPVRVHQLHAHPAARPDMPRRGGEVLFRGQDAGGADDEVESAIQLQAGDDRLVNLEATDAPANMHEHAWMCVHANDLDSLAMKRDREPSGPDAQVQDRWCGVTAPIEPWPEVFGVGQRRIELREPRIRVVRIVPDPTSYRLPSWISHP